MRDEAFTYTRQTLGYSPPRLPAAAEHTPPGDKSQGARVLPGRSPGGHHPKIAEVRCSLGDVTVKPARSRVKHRRPGTW
jgi:hypothetical protein